MATKHKKKKTSVSGKKSKAAKKRRASNPRNARIVRNVCGIFLGILSAYTLIAVVSYIFTWTADQSLLTSSADEIARNSGGRLGFKWARLLVTEMFGIGAFAAVAVFAIAALRCLNRRVRFFRILFLTVFAAVLLSLVSTCIVGFFGDFPIFGEGIGGAYGTAIVNEMGSLMGSVGTVLVLVAAIILFLLFASNRFD